MYRQITKCRICGNENLIPILDLGEQALTGVFPKSKTVDVAKGPLQLVKCDEAGEENHCGLLQLRHTYQLGALYGDNYGYRSGLNSSMVTHLQKSVAGIRNNVVLEPGDLIIDIGSNDATTLKAYPQDDFHLIGIDPVGKKFADYYPEHITLIPDFFSADMLTKQIGNKKAKIITSFSMFYDLEDPVDFARQIVSVMADNGLWVCEQSYMPTMLARNSFDTVCHEHLEYYGLHQIQWIAEKVGLNIIDVTFNDINGGSFAISMAKKGSEYVADHAKIQAILHKEKQLGLQGIKPYQQFADRIAEIKQCIKTFFNKVNNDNKTILGLGASTKGNVLLQYCGLSATELPAIGEVNSDKFNCYTPGTKIPIIAEKAVLEQHPDYVFILPWHFKHFFQTNPNFSAMNLVFPLPTLEILTKEQSEIACD